jgi:hypothetical protein
MKKIIILFALIMTMSLNVFAEVNNTTNYLLFDAERAMGVLNLDDSTQVMVVYLPDNASFDIYTRRHIDGTVFRAIEGTYIVMIARGLTDELASITMIHELSHIRQMQSGKLKIKSLDKVVWKGSPYKVKKTSVLPWELEADVMTRKTIKQLKCKCN